MDCITLCSCTHWTGDSVWSVMLVDLNLAGADILISSWWVYFPLTLVWVLTRCWRFLVSCHQEEGFSSWHSDIMITLHAKEQPYFYSFIHFLSISFVILSYCLSWIWPFVPFVLFFPLIAFLTDLPPPRKVFVSINDYNAANSVTLESLSKCILSSEALQQSMNQIEMTDYRLVRH